MHSVKQNVMKTVIFKHIFCLACSLPSSNEKEHLIILEKQNHTWKARVKVKVIDFNLLGLKVDWINKEKMVNALFWMRKWGDWWYYIPLKTQKTCNRGCKLSSKTSAIWIYNILWNSWPVVHYTVRKTYDIMLPFSLTETCLPWKLGCIGVSIIPPKTPPLLFR